MDGRCACGRLFVYEPGKVATDQDGTPVCPTCVKLAGELARERADGLAALHRREPGTRVVAEQEVFRTVDGQRFRCVCIFWNDTHRVSWDVYDEDRCLTEAESLDDAPTDDDIRELVREAVS